jgi:hypothetical protein
VRVAAVKEVPVSKEVIVEEGATVPVGWVARKK